MKKGTAAVLYRDAPIGSSKSDQLFLYLEGGGSCYDANSCSGAIDPKTIPKQASGYKLNVFQSTNNNKLDNYLYLRLKGIDNIETRTTPFIDMNMGMVPYCTGDSHTGRALRTGKTNVGGNIGPKQYYYFYGHYNFVAAFQYLISQKYPLVKTIWLMGTSAGAGGAAAEYNFIYKNFVVGHSDRHVHLIEDSVPVVPPVAAIHWSDMVAWQTLLPGFSNCTQPPPSPPGGNGIVNGGLQQNAQREEVKKSSNSKANRSRLASTASQSPNGLNGDDQTDPGDYPTGIAYPFPPENDGQNNFARKRKGGFSPTDNPNTLTTPNPGTCYLLQDTRIFNRSRDPQALFSIISFDWDSVLNPYGNTYDPNDSSIGYPAFFTEMDADTSAIENYNIQLPTHHLYIDNRTVTQALGADPQSPAQGTLCGRHVVTNFGIQNPNQDNQDSQLEDAHLGFLTSMLTGTSWSSSSVLLLSCPKNVNDDVAGTFF